jgi:carbon storage regulator
MLILTRKPGESLYIGDVKVTVVELKGHQIRIGIDAPPEIRIYREEIYLQILEENKQAAMAAAKTVEGEIRGVSFPGCGDGSSDSAKKRKGKANSLSALISPAKESENENRKSK